MIDHLPELEPKEQKLLTALLSQPTIAQAATAAGISEATAYRYLKRPDFADAYRTARASVLAHATARLQQLASEAVEALGDAVNDREARPQDRITAARTVLDFAYKAGDLEEILVLIEELKEGDDD